MSADSEKIKGELNELQAKEADSNEGADMDNRTRSRSASSNVGDPDEFANLGAEIEAKAKAQFQADRDFITAHHLTSQSSDTTKMITADGSAVNNMLTASASASAPTAPHSHSAAASKPVADSKLSAEFGALISAFEHLNPPVGPSQSSNLGKKVNAVTITNAASAAMPPLNPNAAAVTDGAIAAPLPKSDDNQTNRASMK